MSKKSLKGLAALSIAALLIGNANAAVALEAPDSSHKALLNLSKVSSDTNVDVLNTSVEAKATMAQQWDCHVRGGPDISQPAQKIKGDKYNGTYYPVVFTQTNHALSCKSAKKTTWSGRTLGSIVYKGKTYYADAYAPVQKGVPCRL
ncbi:hypothetical protein [Glutamicibacter sp. BW77]|uniref:hypothetical protein n=1 Tax=Glutamicibacter sp. BW77 TaxID=2024402 RepID=UPI001142A6A8|nr:hypothetical protein [Glutamicibacter sp. BW77]